MFVFNENEGDIWIITVYYRFILIISFIFNTTRILWWDRMIFNVIESFKKSQIILKNGTRICKKYMSPGSVKANRRGPKSCLGRVFNFKSGCFVICTITWPIKTRPSLKLKTRPRFCPVSLRLSMMSLMLGTVYQTRYFRSSMVAWFAWQGVKKDTQLASCICWNVALFSIEF
jgi:hypothetical protein